MALDPFETLGVSRAYRQDEKALEERHRELTRLLHPDRHAARGPAARQLSLSRMIEVNDAYRILKDPVRRAAYLLELGEGGLSVPQSFLMEVMELREGFDEAKTSRDLKRIEALKAEIASERARQMDTLGDAFDRDDKAGARDAVARIRYHDRFLGEVRAFEDLLFEESHG